MKWFISLLGLIFLITQGYICYLCPVEWLVGFCEYLILYILLGKYKEREEKQPPDEGLNVTHTA